MRHLSAMLMETKLKQFLCSLNNAYNKALKRDLARVAFSICVVFSG